MRTFYRLSKNEGMRKTRLILEFLFPKRPFIEMTFKKTYPLPENTSIVLVKSHITNPDMSDLILKRIESLTIELHVRGTEECRRNLHSILCIQENIEVFLNTKTQEDIEKIRALLREIHADVKAAYQAACQKAESFPAFLIEETLS